MHVVNYLLTEAQIAAGGTFTSEAVNIEKATACAVHTQTLTGVGADIGFTYTLSSSQAGTFVAGEATVNASRGAVGCDDWTPEPASWMKVIITNNNGAAVVTPKVVLAIQED